MYSNLKFKLKKNTMRLKPYQNLKLDFKTKFVAVT